MRVELGRVDLTEEGIERLGACAAEIGSVRAPEVVCAADFVCGAGWATLEALRLRAAAAGVRVGVETAPSSYARPFSAVIGFGGFGSGSNTTLPIERFTSSRAARIGPFLLDEWSSMARRSSRASTEYIVSAVAEIFENGLTHARSDVGVLACGQYYPKRDVLELSVVDLGIGIPGSLAAAYHRREEEIDAVRAIAWAFERGRSSIATSRGLGLAILRGFVARTGARLLVASGGACAQIDGRSWRCRPLVRRFPGTLVTLTLPASEQVRPPVPGEGLF